MHKGRLTWIHYWFLKDYRRPLRMHIPWSCRSGTDVLKLLATVTFLDYAKFCGIQNTHPGKAESAAGGICWEKL